MAEKRPKWGEFGHDDSDELDLDALEVAREIATRDKCDLFDFYHNNWDKLIQEIRSRRELEDERAADAKFEER